MSLLMVVAIGCSAPTTAATTHDTTTNTPLDACGAVVRREQPSVSDPVLATRVVSADNWLELHRVLYGDALSPTNEADARTSLCVRGDVGRCVGDGPWVLSRNLESAYMELEDHVFPIEGGRLLAFHTVVARTNPYTLANDILCVTEQTLEVRLEHGIVHVSRRTQELDENAEPPAFNKPCPRKPEQLEDSVFDARTGRLFLQVSRPGGPDAPRVSVLDEDSAEVRGGACRREIPIR
ncbi:MAG: hypothetical protein U0271_48200 [Polyangiaceae bacterium]